MFISFVIHQKTGSVLKAVDQIPERSPFSTLSTFSGSKTTPPPPKALKAHAGTKEVKEGPLGRQKTAVPAVMGSWVFYLRPSLSRHSFFQRCVFVNMYKFCPGISVRRMWGLKRKKPVLIGRELRLVEKARFVD